MKQQHQKLEPLTLRVPPHLREAMALAAAADRRPLASWARLALEDVVEQWRMEREQEEDAA
jgi:predicted HicB family RNase H-like nuclease